MIITFSCEKFSGTNNFTLYPRFTPIRARPIPGFPAVASTMVPPGASFPSCSARRMMPMAARSFTLPPGFRYSSLANTSADPAGTSRFNCNMGVSPTSWVMSSATRRRDISEVFEGTLQGTRECAGSSISELPQAGVQIQTRSRFLLCVLGSSLCELCGKKEFNCEERKEVPPSSQRTPLATLFPNAPPSGPSQGQFASGYNYPPPRRERNRMRRFAAVLLIFNLILPSLALGADETALVGYAPRSSQAEREWEAKFRAIPDPANLREYMRRLSARPHHVGSPYDKDNAEWILARFKEWGFDAHIETFDVLFPTPKVRVLEMVEPTRFTAKLEEPALAVDPTSNQKSEQLPTYNAYSIDGDETAPLVFVNYVLPQGPRRNPDGVQRGSVMDFASSSPGDPLPPGIGATPGAKRLPLKEAKSLTKIPVLPICYGDAQPLLAALKGPMAPDEWRGSLPIPYHVGPGPARVHLKVQFNWDTKPVNDVIAKIPGSVAPDEWIIRGNPHDAWVNGAEDPVSGQAPLLEEARAMGLLLKQGWKPRRTIIYTAWDGEEPMLLGSTEWVEAHADELRQHAAVYINTDGNDRGLFSRGGSHSLEQFINGVARDIEDP